MIAERGGDADIQAVRATVSNVTCMRSVALTLVQIEIYTLIHN